MMRTSFVSASCELEVFYDTLTSRFYFNRDAKTVLQWSECSQSSAAADRDVRIPGYGAATPNYHLSATETY